MDSQYNTNQTLLEAGMLLGEPKRLNGSEGKPFIIVPASATVRDLEAYLPSPVAIAEVVRCTEATSFLKYVNQFKTPETQLFASVCATGADFTAVLDYHGPGKPSWGQHMAIYNCPQTEEWKRWTAYNNAAMDQQEFAEFIEMNQAQVVSPSGATLLEIARSLVAKIKVDFTSGIRLNNGNVQLQYEQVTEAKAGEKGTLEVPEKFKLGLVLFQGGPAYAIDALLRYRIVERKLTFHFVLVNPHLIIADAVQKLRDYFEEGLGIETVMATVDR